MLGYISQIYMIISQNECLMVVEGNGAFRYYQVTILAWARAAVKAVGVTASQANHVGEVTRSGSKSGGAMESL